MLSNFQKDNIINNSGKSQKLVELLQTYIPNSNPISFRCSNNLFYNRIRVFPNPCTFTFAFPIAIEKSWHIVNQVVHSFLHSLDLSRSNRF